MSRSTPHRRPWRLAVAALTISSGLIATLSRAQNADPVPVGLRDSDGLATLALPPAVAATPDVSQAGAAPNGQKSKPKPRQNRRAGTALPLLRPYPGAQRAGALGGPPAVDPALTPAPTIAAAPLIPAKHRPRAEEKPFDPTGVMLGDIKLLPTIEEDVGYASNPLSLSGPTKGSTYESTQAGLTLQSEWGRHDLHGTLSGGYADYFNDHPADAPNANGVIDGRLDITRDASLDAEGRFNIAVQTPGSVTLPTGIVLGSNSRPLVESYGATVGGLQKFGDLALSLHGTLDHTTYQNATLGDGSTENLASDDFSDWGLRARAAYQISPVITPYIETVVDTRIYDIPIDSGGYARQSNGVLGRAGAVVAFTGQLTGEASLGYGERQYQDARLPDLRAPLVDASLIWSVTPLTTVTVKTSTNLADTTNIGDSGAVSRAYTIDVSHALWRNFTIGANAGYLTDVYAGFPLHDATTSFGLHADYNVTRDIVLRASASHTQFVSSASNSNYAADIFMLGLRLQR